MAGAAQGELGRAYAALEARAADLAEANRRLESESEQREQAEEALVQSRKLEAIGQLTGGIAHDFNNLLTVVLGGLRLLERHAEPERRAATMEAMRHAVERGAGLTRQLLAFARRDALQLVPVDVREQVDVMRPLLERSLRADILVEIDIRHGIWPVLSDPAQLELAILNLSVNARDAMPKGGVLTISARNLDPEASVEISVHDTGVGIPADVIDRVFEPYFTTKQVGQGTGLGLSQVYGFAIQSGGSIKIDSEVGFGTTVRLFLPRSQISPEAASPRPNGLVAARVAANILVVEDDDAVAATVAAMLDDLRHHHKRVASVDAALKELEADDRYDLLFSDITMPGGRNGVELAEEVSGRWPTLPILLTSGYRGSGDEPRFPVLRKPYQLEQLDEAINAMVHEA